MLMVKETNLSPVIDIYTSSGNKLGSILVNIYGTCYLYILFTRLTQSTRLKVDQKRMPIVKMGWSDDERLIIITEYVHAPLYISKYS